MYYTMCETMCLVFYSAQNMKYLGFELMLKSSKYLQLLLLNEIIKGGNSILGKLIRFSRRQAQ